MMNMNSCNLTVVIGCLFVLFGFSPMAHAQPSNFGFETGDTTSWSLAIPSGGSATAVESHQGLSMLYAPFHGDYFLELKTNGPGSYTTATQAVSLGAGETITGAAAFSCRESSFFNDDAYVEILDAAGGVIATPWYESCASLGYSTDGPWTEWSFTPQAAGTYTVSYRVANQLDSVVDAFALFDSTDDDVVLSTTATFNVTKDFTDDNPTPVEVKLTCNAGLPLEQSFSIVDADASETLPSNVTFSVASFEDGAMDCTVTEIPLEGYTPGYEAGGESNGDNGTDEEPACRFFDVSLGDANSCEITNSLQSKEAHVHKEWVIDENGVASVSPAYRLELFCDGEILGGASQGQSDIWYLELYEGSSLGFIDQDFQPDVYPNWDGGTNCWVIETIYDDSVEASNGCGSENDPGLLVTISGSEPSCTITNTVFFEGIPTLSQFGLALLALLMLGIGFVGMRRFV